MGKYEWSDKANERRDERRGGPVKKPVKIQQRTKAGADADKLYLELNRRYLKIHPVCEVCQTNRATQIHHRKGRGVWLLIVEHFLAVCSTCHKKIEDKPEWAKANHYSLNRLD